MSTKQAQISRDAARSIAAARVERDFGVSGVAKVGKVLSYEEIAVE